MFIKRIRSKLLVLFFNVHSIIIAENLFSVIICSYGCRVKLNAYTCTEKAKKNGKFVGLTTWVGLKYMMLMPKMKSQADVSSALIK